jgi:undecaprenyl-diphosphatase
MIVVVICSTTIVAEFLDQIHIPSTFPRLSDSFPEPLSTWDTYLFLGINVGLANPVISQFLSIVTILGGLSASVIVCGALFLFGNQKKAINASSSLILISLLTLFLKILIMRPRPYMAIPTAIIVSVESGWSFPSGHSGRIFSLLPSSNNASRTLRLFGYLIASLVAFSRIYLGVHYLSDVFLGAIIGYISGFAASRFNSLLSSKLESRMTKLNGIFYQK